MPQRHEVNAKVSELLTALDIPHAGHIDVDWNNPQRKMRIAISGTGKLTPEKKEAAEQAIYKEYGQHNINVIYMFED